MRPLTLATPFAIGVAGCCDVGAKLLHVCSLTGTKLDAHAVITPAWTFFTFVQTYVQPSTE